ncbi:MAG: hypothetical protein RXR36_05750, partial [Nitrososphaeria archaeon]
MNRNLVIVGIIAILVVAGIAYELYPQYTKQTTPVSTSSTTVAFPVALTDPPSVPPGTSALWLNYTAVE